MLKIDTHQEPDKLKRIRNNRARIIDCICSVVSKCTNGRWPLFFRSARRSTAHTWKIRRQLLHFGGQGLASETMTEVLLTASAAVRAKRLEAVQAVRDLERLQAEIDVCQEIWYHSKTDLWHWTKYPVDPAAYENWYQRPENIARWKAEADRQKARKTSITKK